MSWMNLCSRCCCSCRRCRLITTIIIGVGRISRNVLGCWFGYVEEHFDIVTISMGSRGAETAAHILKYDTNQQAPSIS